MFQGEKLVCHRFHFWCIYIIFLQNHCRFVSEMICQAIRTICLLAEGKATVFSVCFERLGVLTFCKIMLSFAWSSMPETRSRDYRAICYSSHL